MTADLLRACRKIIIGAHGEPPSHDTGCGVCKITKRIDAYLASPPERWIPVGERLPDTESDVLIYHVLGDQGRSPRAYDVAAYISGAWVFPWGKEISPHWVTHWMKLPSPPKEEV